MHTINVPPVGGDPVTVTITGHNGAATFDDYPDLCDIFPPESGERGWWEGFHIDKCANVRIDLCCTDINGEPMRPAWGNLIKDCPCGELLQNSFVDPPCGTGGWEPWLYPWLFCDEDNLWQTFGPLQAGSYYYPIYTVPNGTSGVPPGASYQMHITVCPCEAAACCIQDTCQVLNTFECADAGGYWLAPPNVDLPVEDCTGSPCASGSCCTAPGACVDEIAPGQPMDRTTCEVTFDGDYVGGALCDNPGDPCPVCDIEDPGHCQSIRSGNYTVTLSDLTAPGGSVLRADDFIPLGNTINTVCVWGAYLDGNLPDGEYGCSEYVTDNFRVTVYGDAGGMPDDTNIIGTSTVAVLNRKPYPGTSYESLYFDDTGEPMFAYRLVLTTPITDLIPSECYWMEIVNSTPSAPEDPPNTCEWHWAHAWGNNYSFAGSCNPISGLPEYAAHGERGSDMAFCVDCGMDTRGCGTDVRRACCTCYDALPPSTCTAEPLSDCTGGVWDMGGTTCTGYQCPTTAPAGDTCANAIEITDGTYLFNTTCAETDGPDGPGAAWSVRNENGGLVGFGKEIWFKYNMTVGVDLLQFSTCAGGSGDDTYDGMIALFHNPSHPTECVCPGDDHFMQDGLGSDEGCNGISDLGQGYLRRYGYASECWMIAVGGFEGAAGPGVLEVTAVPIDDCVYSPPPIAEPTLPDIGSGTRVRYLGFQADPGVAGRQQAIRVTFTDLPPPFEYANARTMWVGEPDEVSEIAGSSLLPPYYWLSGLQCDPYWTDWTQYPAVFVRSESFVPEGIYEVQAIDETCSTTSEADYSEPLPIKLSKWGDVVGTCLPETSPHCIRAYGYTDCCTAPNGVVDFDDIVAPIDKFKNSVGAPRMSRADVTPSLPDRILDFKDIPAVVNAFRGLPYPHSGPPAIDPCAK
jgi:hypothetical protein